MYLPVLSLAMPFFLSLLTNSSLSSKTTVLEDLLKCPCPCEVIPESGRGPFSRTPSCLPTWALWQGTPLGKPGFWQIGHSPQTPSWWELLVHFSESAGNIGKLPIWGLLFCKENWIILLLWCLFHLEVRIRFLRKRRMWRHPEDPGVEEFHSRWHLEDPLPSLPSLPFIINPRVSALEW